MTQQLPVPVAPRGLVGVVHLKPLPGDPKAPLAPAADVLTGVRDAALADVEALAAGGAGAVILENFGSAPFAKGGPGDRIPPHQVATLTLLAAECRARFGLATGVNCLRNDAFSAMGIAAAADLAFIRVNVHSGSYVTDQGLIEGEAAATLRYRRSLGAPVAICADVLVKHAAPLAPISAEDATGDLVERGLADAVIVTGSATGAPVDEALLRTVKDAAGPHPVLIGSGLTPELAPRLLPHCDGAIVGSWLKTGGELFAPIDRERVARLAGFFDDPNPCEPRTEHPHD